MFVSLCCILSSSSIVAIIVVQDNFTAKEHTTRALNHIREYLKRMYRKQESEPNKRQDIQRGDGSSSGMWHNSLALAVQRVYPPIYTFSLKSDEICVLSIIATLHACLSLHSTTSCG